MKIRLFLFISICFIGVQILVMSCNNETSLVADYAPQNNNPHCNAFSLQPGVHSGNYFDFTLHAGMKDKIDREILPPNILQEFIKIQPSRIVRRVLKDVSRVSFILEYWGTVVEFRLLYDRGDFFEKKSNKEAVTYSIGAPFIVPKSGMTNLPIEIEMDSNYGNPDSEAVERGDIITLKFRSKRTGEVPISFAGKFGSAYNSTGKRLTGIGWYGGRVTNYFN